MGIGIVIADLNQIAVLKLSILAPVNSDRRSEPNTVLILNINNIKGKTVTINKYISYINLN